MSETYNIKRQAVVIIHGIGEQRPMETLRGFVKGIKAELEAGDNAQAEKRSTVRSKPDSVGDIYETVRLSMDSARDRPITDFYEFYWAHNMRSNQFGHMVTWVRRLVFTGISNVPTRLKRLWWSIWVLFLVFMAVVIYFSCGGHYSALRRIIAPLAAIFIFPLLVSLAGTIAKKFILNYAGDAARYFTPDPDNIGERSHIRQQGITFLQKLHTITSGSQVDRIIIVAHSLGSVVAYDLMRLLWSEYNKVFTPKLDMDQRQLKALDAFELTEDRQSLKAFRAQQFAAWQEQRLNGNPWLISDFITLGGALNAADYFIVSQEPFETLVKQRELPVCPPLKDEKDGKMIYCPPAFDIEGKKRSVWLLNWSAMFAVTRWTNIYFRSDYVGGPMKRKFGNGVLDIEKPRKGFFLFPGGHTDYWNLGDKRNALKEIVAAMKLRPSEES
jgi:hypothetical protein